MAKDNTPPSSRAPAVAESIAKPSNDGDVKFGERLARMEGKVDHLATKEDVAELKAVIASLNGQFKIMIWVMGILFPAVAAGLFALAI